MPMIFTPSRNFICLHAPEKGRFKFDLQGVHYDDHQVRFDKRIWDESGISIVSHAITGTRLNLPTPARFMQGGFEPGEEELEVINRYHAKRTAPYTEEELYIFERYPANNVPSRSIRLRFTKRALQKMAADATAGRTRLLYHEDNQPVGRTIFGEVVDANVQGVSGYYLRTVEYMEYADDDAMKAIRRVQSGIFNSDSVGVYLGTAIEYKDIEDDDGSFSIIEVDLDESSRQPLELHEISFVHLGELVGVGALTSSGTGDKKTIDVSGNSERMQDDVTALLSSKKSGPVEVSRRKKKETTKKYSRIIQA